MTSWGFLRQRLSADPFLRPGSLSAIRNCPGGKLKLFVFAALPAIDAARTPDEGDCGTAQAKRIAGWLAVTLLCPIRIVLRSPYE
jgi:hypothetical protein